MWGQKERWLTELQESGKQIPALDSKPDITGYEWIWEAFTNLMGDRNVGMATGPIPWSAIDRYAVRYDIVGYDFEMLVHGVQELDAAYMNSLSDGKDRKEKSNGRPSKNNPVNRKRIRR